MFSDPEDLAVANKISDIEMKESSEDMS